MTLLSHSQTIQCTSGYQEFEIDSSEDMTLDISCETEADVYFRIQSCGKLTIHTTTSAMAKASYLFWNATTKPCQVMETHKVYKDGDLKIAYGECGADRMDRTSDVFLLEEGANALVTSASLVTQKVSFNLQVVSKAPHTTGIMENYGVVLHGGQYVMEATGKIDKGAHGSASHQTSRCLCFEEGQTSTILPKLLIDENDVQASHATSLGRVDEDQMYYMQTRGLTVKQCTGLISTGYLMPITQAIHQETLSATLQKELEGKIAQLCLM